jgi:hypothetical protein
MKLFRYPLLMPFQVIPYLVTVEAIPGSCNPFHSLLPLPYLVTSEAIS